MSSPLTIPRIPDVAPVLAEAGWLRALARQLIDDPSIADDLAQATIVSALDFRPDTDRPIRGWLATVLRNHWRQWRRGARRSSDRERAAAQAERQPSALDAVAKVALQRDLAAAVLALDEPFRTAVSMRFFDGRSQREIANLTGVSPATVNSRIHRGLQKLRGRLDARYGDRRAWSALVQLAALPKATLWSTALLMNTTTKTVGAVALIGAAALMWNVLGSTPAHPGGTDVAAAVPAERARLAPSSDGVRGDARSALPAAAELEPGAVARSVAGRVLDPTGSPVGGIALRGITADGHAIDGARASSDSRGTFAIPVVAGMREIAAEDPRYTTVLAGYAEVTTDAETVVLVARRTSLAGRVVDSSGLPLAGVTLSVRTPSDVGAELETVLDYSLPRSWVRRTGDDGRFAFDDVPALPRATLHARRDGYRADVRAVPDHADRHLEIVLERPRHGDGALAGVVLDPAGAIVPGARVALGLQSTVADAAGRFSFELAAEPDPARVVAVRRGFTPATRRLGSMRDAAGKLPVEVVLQLGEPPAAITGRVVDHAGSPVAGAKVWLSDPTPFGFALGSFLQVETMLSRDDPPVWSFETTGADGRFRIEGLLDRDYRLEAVAAATLTATRTDPVPAGNDVEIVLPSDRVWPRVAGTVVAGDGGPVEGVRLQLERMTFEVDVGEGTIDRTERGASVVTDASGRFEFEDVPTDGIRVAYGGDGIMLGSIELADPSDPEAVSIVVRRKLNLQVRLDQPSDRADRVRVLDESGRALLLRIMRGAGSITGRSVAIVLGRTQVFSVSDRARTVVVYRDGVEVARRPVSLTPGGLNQLTF